MSVSLTDALAQVDLEPGTYHCDVNGKRIEVRVLPPNSTLPASIYDESDVMLDPWVEFPTPTSGIFVKASVGTLHMPDPPDIPPDDEGEL